MNLFLLSGCTNGYAAWHFNRRGTTALRMRYNRAMLLIKYPSGLILHGWR